MMHHPLDWLHDEERGNVRGRLTASAKFLLRGHLHDTEAQAVLENAKGVLYFASGAAYQSRQWPRRAYFGRVELAVERVTILPIRYEEKASEMWTVDPSIFPRSQNYQGEFSFDWKPDEATRLTGTPVAHPCTVSSHTRTWRVLKDGLAEVSVELVNLKASDNCIIAMPSDPLCDSKGDLQANAGASNIQVSAFRNSEGRLIYRLLCKDMEATTLQWRYQISNSLALTKRELEMMKPGDGEHLGDWFVADKEFDGRPHLVRFPATELKLVTEFDGTYDAVIDRVQAIVERREGDHGEETWKRVKTEESRCSAELVSPTRAQLRVTSPVVGYRYSLAYRPTREGAGRDSVDLTIIEKTLDRCRGSLSFTGASSSEFVLFTRFLSAALEICKLPWAEGDDSSCVGFLWSQRRKQLFASFGRFPNRSWNARFRYGQGVAGHCFRFSRTVSWHRDNARSPSLLYKPVPSGGGEYSRDYDWVVCIPVLTHPTGASVGVVSFAGVEPKTETESKLASFARSEAESRTTEEMRSAIDNLTGIVSLSFWLAVARSQYLAENELQAANQRANNFSTTDDSPREER